MGKGSREEKNGGCWRRGGGEIAADREGGEEFGEVGQSKEEEGERARRGRKEQRRKEKVGVKGGQGACGGGDELGCGEMVSGKDQGGEGQMG